MNQCVVGAAHSFLSAFLRDSMANLTSMLMLLSTLTVAVFAVFSIYDAQPDKSIDGEQQPHAIQAHSQVGENMIGPESDTYDSEYVEWSCCSILGG